MVCEDDEDLCHLLKLALGTKYTVIGVNSGNECIEKFIVEKSLGSKIHLILLDYKLGDMPGVSVAKKIKE